MIEGDVPTAFFVSNQKKADKKKATLDRFHTYLAKIFPIYYTYQIYICYI
jgi:hypothetical protein